MNHLRQLTEDPRTIAMNVQLNLNDAHMRVDCGIPAEAMVTPEPVLRWQYKHYHETPFKGQARPCEQCRKSCDDEPAVVGLKGRNVRFVHVRCFRSKIAFDRELMKRQLDERLTAQLRSIRERIPDIPWARTDDPEFAKRVPNERLQGLASKWTPSAGSALILGPSGIGKTSAVVALVHRLMNVTHMVTRDVFGVYEYDIGLLKRFVWTTGAELANAREQSRLGDEPAILHTAKASTLLVVDEVGSEPVSNNLMEVVDVRYAHHKPTIITSGKTVEEFSKRYGDGLVRRVSYKPHGVPVFLHPPKRDMRKASQSTPVRP